MARIEAAASVSKYVNQAFDQYRDPPKPGVSTLVVGITWEAFC